MNKVGSDGSTRLIFNGLITGGISTVLFNSLDRALFLMVKENKPILTASLWRHPYQGVTNAIYGRVIGYGIFFSLSDIYRDFFKDKTTHPTLCGSLATATTTVLLCQPVNVMKMYQWNHHVPGAFISSGTQLISKYGWKVMFKGFYPACVRDGIFASTYIGLSEKLNPDKYFTVNLAIASMATTISSPANYYRNRQFFNFDDRKIPLRKTVRELIDETKTKEGLVPKIQYVVHKRLNIGWGTLRVGLGIALANKIYDYLK